MARMRDHFHPGGHINYGTEELESDNVLDGLDEADKKALFVPQQRSRINLLGILVNIFCPWILTTAVYWVMAGKLHYTSPNLAWLIVLSAFALVAFLAVTARIRKQNDQPSWFTYCTGSCLVGVILATVCGNLIFTTEINMYYDYLNLNTYSAVNPAHETGQMVMDAGIVYFGHGVHLDTKKTAGFKHGDTYCVVPITHDDEKLPSYDFWAVGVNCCDNPRKFHCGRHYDNFRARSGLRLMNEEQRPFFRLAVQQAEAAYGITAAHPVFFYWAQDPLHDVNLHFQRAVRYFIIGSSTFFVSNVIGVISATFAFAKMGRV